MTVPPPSVLVKICERRRADIARDAARRPLGEIEAALSRMTRPRRSLRDALARADGNPIKVIAEFKRASPSAGAIHSDANVAEVVAAYRRAGAVAVSVLTEPTDFGGSLDDLRVARAATDLPILRKDFMVEPYQFYEAAEAGADIVLLIAAALGPERTNAFATLARSLSLEVLLEIHALEELRGIDIGGVDVVGVNNRNLHTLRTDVTLSFVARQRLPTGVPLISESGLRDAATLTALHRAGYAGFLIGEALMSKGDPGQSLAELLRAADPAAGR